MHATNIIQIHAAMAREKLTEDHRTGRDVIVLFIVTEYRSIKL